MSTTFKVGDRVKHRLGDAVIVPKGERFAYIPDGYVCFRVIGYDYGADDDHHSCAASELTLVEPAAPAPDTRKRLRDITDLADGDVVVIAGWDLTIDGRDLVGTDGGRVVRWAAAGMLVDEVRRKPPIIYIASPFTHDSKEEWRRFLRAADVMSLAVVRAGGYPVSPVILSSRQPKILEREQEYAWWTEATKEMLRRCDGMLGWSNDGKSKGVEGERVECSRRIIPYGLVPTRYIDDLDEIVGIAADLIERAKRMKARREFDKRSKDGER